MKLILLLILCFINFSSLAQEPNSIEDFKKLLKEHSAKFNLPKDFTEAPIKASESFPYVYAIKHTEQKFEIRYLWYSIQAIRTELDKLDSINTDPNLIYQVMTYTTVMNLIEGPLQEIRQFPAEYAKETFGADDCAMTAFPFKSELEIGYRGCGMFVIHKKDIADLYLFFLFDDNSVFEENYQSAISTITFN